MVDTKSAITLASELKTYLRAKNRELDVSDNSLINDMILDPYSIGGDLLMDQVELVKNLHILSKVTGNDLDTEATNYNLERLPGTYAYVTVTFYAVTKPTGNVEIAANSQVRTAGTKFTSPTMFTATAEYNFPLADVDSYYSHDRNRYEFEATFRADQIGSDGNVSSTLVSAIVGTISFIDGVTNFVAASGGTNEESDDDLRKRIGLAKTGRDINTVNGLRVYLTSLGFLDTNVIRVEETGYQRATGVDAFVIDYSTTSVSEVFVYNSAQQRYYFTNRPILEVTSVVSDVSGQLSASVYSTSIDYTSPLRRSKRAQDFIEILPSAGLTNGTRFTVTYNYSSLINQSQSTIELPNNKVLTADILIKRAYPMYLYMTATLTLKANADGPTTRAKVKNALAQFLSSYRLGDDLQKSDLIVVIQQGYGEYPIVNVDAVVISNYYLQDEFGNQYPAVNEVIALNNSQHAVYGSATIL